MNSNIIIEINPNHLIFLIILIIVIFIIMLSIIMLLSIKIYKIRNIEIYEKKLNDDLKNKLLKLHMKYLSSILILIIIILFTCLVYNIGDMNEKISFASTVSSIILSILAIFMSIIGEGKTNQLQSQIEDCSKVLTSASDKLNDNIDSIIEKLNESIKVTTELRKDFNGNIGWEDL